MHLDASLGMLKFVLSVLLVDDQWFWHKHPWNTDQSDQKEENWKTLLKTIWANYGFGAWVDSSTVKEHANHHRDDRRSFIFSVSEVSQPLTYNHQVHISKEHPQKDDLRDEFQKEIELVLEVQSIGSFHADTKRHLHHTQDNWKLHLQRIQEVQLIHWQVPSRVNTNWVHTVGELNHFRSWVVCGIGANTSSQGMGGILIMTVLCSATLRNGVATVKYEKWDRHEVIVDEATISCEESHEQDQVSNL